jgi:hypothetical protein
VHSRSRRFVCESKCTTALNLNDLVVLQWDREAAEAALRREMMLQAEIPRLYEVCIFDPLFGNLMGSQGACAIVSWLRVGLLS